MKTRMLLTLLTLGGSLLWAADGATLAKENGCFACHQVVGKKSAPAFRGIANRNLRMHGSSAKSVIIQSIKNGSKGKYPQFTDSQMPPYPQLSSADLDTLADWILSQARQGGRGMGKGRGMGGGGMGRGMGGF